MDHLQRNAHSRYSVLMVASPPHTHTHTFWKIVILFSYWKKFIYVVFELQLLYVSFVFDILLDVWCVSTMYILHLSIIFFTISRLIRNQEMYKLPFGKHEGVKRLNQSFQWTGLNELELVKTREVSKFSASSAWFLRHVSSLACLLQTYFVIDFSFMLSQN